MPVDAHLRLSGGLASAREARRFVLHALEADYAAEDVDSAVLLVSELVTNALLHAGSPCELDLASDGDALLISVSDRDPRIPVRRLAYSDELSTGRGLRLLEALCERWGVDRQDPGKTVWCRLPAVPA